MSSNKLERAIVLMAFLFLWAADPLRIETPFWYLMIVIGFWLLARGGRPPD